MSRIDRCDFMKVTGAGIALSVGAANNPLTANEARAQERSAIWPNDYYRKRIYAGRPDCIYRVEEGRAVRKTSARYHVNSDERQKDVGLHFENAFVLLSDDFRYLGKKSFGSPWTTQRRSAPSTG
jgi:hypothetical protein